MRRDYGTKSLVAIPAQILKLKRPREYLGPKKDIQIHKQLPPFSPSFIFESNNIAQRLRERLMDYSSCPFCHQAVPSSDLERHANNHFEDEGEDRLKQQQLERDLALAQQFALSPSSPMTQSQCNTLSNDVDYFDSVEFGNSFVDGTKEDKEWGMVEKNSRLIDLQIRSPFYKVEGGLIALLRNCLELEPVNSISIVSGYVDHFQSIETEDIGWGCGWRNIQMLCSHLLVQREEAGEVLFGGSGFVPDIPSLQRWLEVAWQKGFDVHGSDHFNHSIYGSKKWIGTTECATLLRYFGLRARIVDFGPKEYESLYLSVPGSSLGKQNKMKSAKIYGPMDRYLSCDSSQARSMGQRDISIPSVHLDNEKDGGISTCAQSMDSFTKKREGYQVLMDFIWNYFSDKRLIQAGQHRVVVSDKAPLYFQHDGHSRTVVGIQVKHQSTRNPQYNLLILDPGHVITWTTASSVGYYFLFVIESLGSVIMLLGLSIALFFEFHIPS